MSVRGRLNEVYVFGALFWAAILGAGFNSWAVFGVTAACLIGLNIIGGSIRFGNEKSRRFAHRRFATCRR
jgi:hypothetical protein